MRIFLLIKVPLFVTEWSFFNQFIMIDMMGNVLIGSSVVAFPPKRRTAPPQPFVSGLIFPPGLLFFSSYSVVPLLLI